MGRGYIFITLSHITKQQILTAEKKKEPSRKKVKNTQASKYRPFWLVKMYLPRQTFMFINMYFLPIWDCNIHKILQPMLPFQLTTLSATFSCQ